MERKKNTVQNTTKGHKSGRKPRPFITLAETFRFGCFFPYVCAVRAVGDTEDAYSFLNIAISARLLTLPCLDPKSRSAHCICTHLKCSWNSRTEIGMEKPDRAESQFPGVL